MSTDIITHTRPVVTRCDAKQAGLPTFYLGKLCNSGHRAERFVSNRKCVECCNGIDPTRTPAQNKAMLADKAERDRERNYEDRHHRLIREANAAMRRRRARNRVKTNWGSIIRQDRMRQADGEHTAQDIVDIYESQSGLCVYCSADLEETSYHIDHIYPISLGGSNWPRNLQLTCPRCNIRKHAKHPAEFAAQVGVPFTLDVKSLMSEWAINAQF